MTLREISENPKNIFMIKVYVSSNRVVREDFHGPSES